MYSATAGSPSINPVSPAVRQIQFEQKLAKFTKLRDFPAAEGGSKTLLLCGLCDLLFKSLLPIYFISLENGLLSGGASRTEERVVLLNFDPFSDTMPANPIQFEQKPTKITKLRGFSAAEGGCKSLPLCELCGLLFKSLLLIFIIYFGERSP